MRFYAGGCPNDTALRFWQTGGLTNIEYLWL